MFPDQVNQGIDGLACRDVELDAFLADIEVYFTGGPTHVAKIGIGHFPWSVDDAAHDGDGHSLEVAGGLANAAGRRLEIK